MTETGPSSDLVGFSAMLLGAAQPTTTITRSQVALASLTILYQTQAAKSIAVGGGQGNRIYSLGHL